MVQTVFAVRVNSGSRVGWSLSKLSLGESPGTSWTGQQSITPSHKCDEREKQACIQAWLVIADTYTQ